MIAHIVMFRPPADMAAEEREALLAAIEHAFTNIPQLERVRVGRRRLLGHGYDAKMAEHFEFAAVLEFATAAALASYLADPAHAELGRRFFASAEAALVYDFECVDPSLVPIRVGLNLLIS